MSFEIFDHKSSKRMISDSPVLSIQANGVIRLNKAAAASLGEPAQVVMLWDRQNRKIGISPAKDGDERAYRISYANGSAKIVPRAFLKYIGFTSERTLNLPAELSKGILQASLPTGKKPET